MGVLDLRLVAEYNPKNVRIREKQQNKRKYINVIKKQFKRETEIVITLRSSNSCVSRDEWHSGFMCGQDSPAINCRNITLGGKKEK